MNNSTEGRDPELWEIAKRRASFKGHLATYLVINAFLWILWYFTSDRNESNFIPWPLWSTIGWGVGLTFHFLGAYVFPRSASVENEYQKLKQKQSQ